MLGAPCFACSISYIPKPDYDEQGPYRMVCHGCSNSSFRAVSDGPGQDSTASYIPKFKASSLLWLQVAGMFVLLPS